MLDNLQFTIYNLDEPTETLTILFLSKEESFRMKSDLVEGDTSEFSGCPLIKGMLIDGRKSNILYDSKTKATVLLDDYNGQKIIEICSMFMSL